MTSITDHLATVRARVRESLERAGRASDDVTIVAVSKQQSTASIQDAYRAGQRDFGESYVQEAEPKLDALESLDVTWHFIGRIQANKTRAIAARFQWVHTVDRDKAARRLDAQRPTFAPPLNVLIQVNQGAEGQKAGVAPDDVRALAAVVRELPRLRLRGLMTIPPAGLTPQATLARFLELAQLQASLAAEGYGVDTLSMGMSGDFELALEAGSNCVRIGTAIFGGRAGSPR